MRSIFRAAAAIAAAIARNPRRSSASILRAARWAAAIGEVAVLALATLGIAADKRQTRGIR